jgi:hypothetical protein
MSKRFIPRVLAAIGMILILTASPAAVSAAPGGAAGQALTASWNLFWSWLLAPETTRPGALASQPGSFPRKEGVGIDPNGLPRLPPLPPEAATGFENVPTGDN